MRDDVRALYEVQKLDQESLSLREQIRLYGPQLEQVEARHERKRKELAEFEAKETELKKKHHKFESDIKEKQDQINKSLTKQSQVKTNQEFHALTKEIDTCKKDITKIEDQILENLNEQDKLRVEIAKERKEFRLEEEEIKEEKERIEKKIAEKKERLIQIKKEKALLLVKVDPDLLRFYQKLEKKFRYNVVAFVKNKSCQGCFFQLLSQELVELHQEEKVVYCRNCRRILAEDLDLQNKKSE